MQLETLVVRVIYCTHIGADSVMCISRPSNQFFFKGVDLEGKYAATVGSKEGSERSRMGDYDMVGAAVGEMSNRLKKREYVPASKRVYRMAASARRSDLPRPDKGTVRICWTIRTLAICARKTTCFVSFRLTIESKLHHAFVPEETRSCATLGGHRLYIRMKITQHI